MDDNNIFKQCLKFNALKFKIYNHSTPLKHPYHEDTFIICTESISNRSRQRIHNLLPGGIYALNIKTNILYQLYQYHPHIVFRGGHNAFIKNQQKLFVLGGKDLALIIYDLKINSVDLDSEEDFFEASEKYDSLLQVGKYAQCEQISHNFHIIASWGNSMIYYDNDCIQNQQIPDPTKTVFAPCMMYKSIQNVAHDLYFFGLPGDPSCYSMKFDQTLPLHEQKMNKYHHIQLPWKKYDFSSIKEFWPIYRILSPFQALIFVIIINEYSDIYWLDLEQQICQESNIKIPEQWYDDDDGFVYVNKNIINFISVNKKLRLQFDLFDDIPSKILQLHYNKKFKKRNMTLISGYYRRIKNSDPIPIVIAALIIMKYYFPNEFFSK